MGTAPEAATGSCTLVRLGTQVFGLRTADVIEMAPLGEVSRVPDVLPHVRGVMTLRGRVLPVIDLRLRMGMASSREALDQLIADFDACEQDHRNWIDELDGAARGGLPFRQTTDPHACAFGRWYDGLRADDEALAAQLTKIDGPHQRMHRRGAVALARMAAGDLAGAQAIADDIRTHELAGILALSGEAKAALRTAHRETVVVMRTATAPLAVAVDGVEAVEPLQEANICPAAVSLLRSSGSLVDTIRTRARGGELVVLLDLGRLARSEIHLNRVACQTWALASASASPGSG